MTKVINHSVLPHPYPSPNREGRDSVVDLIIIPVATSPSPFGEGFRVGYLKKKYNIQLGIIMNTRYYKITWTKDT